MKFKGVFLFDRFLTVKEFNMLKEFVEKRHNDADYPDYYCQWDPIKDGSGLEWDGNEKFHRYVEWLKYLITHFFQPWGLTLNGSVLWRGEEFGDDGVIVVEDNQVTTRSLYENPFPTQE